MGRVLTNNVSMSYSIESALGVAGTTWFLIEPNAINSFGAEITTVARNPISRNRQRRKGTVTDLDSSVEIDEDWTLSSFRDFAEGFCFSTGVNTDVTQLATTATETVADTYAVAALTAAQADKFEFSADGSTLIWVDSYVTSANNGLKVVDADIATSATLISVEENVVDETAPANAKLSFAGFRIDAAATPVWTYSSPQAVLSGVTGLGTTLQQIGLTLGQRVHIGSVASEGSSTIQNALENAAPDDMFGYARVIAFDANTITFDKLDAALQFTDAAVAVDVDIVFGEFIRNVATTSAEFLERSFQFEAEFPNLDVGGASKFQYAIGNFCDTAVFNLPGQDKATATFGFIGTDTEHPVVAGSRKTGASAATNPTQTGAFNTTEDIAVLRITQVDETGLTTDFKSLTMTLGNEVSPEKVLGQLGAKFMNTGNFQVDLESELIFTDSAVIDAIRDNTTLTMDFVIKNDDGVVAVDIPSMTLGGGERSFPENESVLISVTGTAFQDDALGSSIGISIFPVPLP